LGFPTGWSFTTQQATTDAKVEASDRQVHLLIQACEDRSKGWLMWLKIFGSKGGLVFVDLRVVVG
jgi:hypothetical protein